MKISDLLDVPMLAGSRVAAGHEGLHRLVQSVNMMDSPDFYDYLKPKELLLTTGYAIKDNPEILTELVIRMAELGCAGLGIKTKRYLDAIPHPAIEAANRLHFPLLELSSDCFLSEALHQLLGRIMESHAEEMRYALDSHRYFSEILLEGKSLQTVLDELSRLLNDPVMLVGRDYIPFATSSQFKSPIHSEVLPYMEEWLAPLLATNSDSSTLLPSEGKPIPYSSMLHYPIQTDSPQGYLISFTNDSSPHPLHHLTLEQAANVISFELLKRQAVKERSRRYKNDFFGDLVDGLISDKQDLIHRGRRYGLDDDCSYFCVVIKKDLPITPSRSFASEIDRSNARHAAPSSKEDLYELVKREAAKWDTPFILFAKNDALVMFIPADANASLLPPENHNFSESFIATYFKNMIQYLWTRYSLSLSCGISNLADQISKLPQAYQEALDAIDSGVVAGQQRFVQFYHVKELSDLFRMIPQENLEEFIRDTFSHLLSSEEKEQTELLKTLRIFYDNHCHIADTAKQLYLHRNTVIYRLDKCEQLTGRSLRAPANSLRFRAAFLMRDILK